MSRVNTLAIAGRLQAMGFSALGARQLATAELLSDARDRQRLALFFAGFFEANAIQPGGSNGSGRSPTITTQSGIVIEIQDESGASGGTTARKSAASRSTVSTQRTRSGIVVSFEDDA